jgi:glycosyltransferase involved in cell wall biosynthesis
MDLEKKVLDMQLNSTVLMVAVYMITYNHEDYIEQAIESIVNQKANFLYKLFIGEDCSTDNTRQICIGLKEKYPDKIHLVLNERNVGASQNAQKIFNLCFNSGAKYVAMCEGDDYWTDPLKLQKQVDFMEANPEFVLVGAKAHVLKGEKMQKKVIGGSLKMPAYDLREVMSYNDFITCTVLFKNVDITINMPTDIAFGDWWVYCTLLAKGGQGKILDEIFSVYRVHERGVMSTLGVEKIEKNLLKQYVLLKRKYRYDFTAHGKSEIDRISKKKIATALGSRNLKDVFTVIYVNYLLNRRLSFIGNLITRFLQFLKIRLASTYLMISQFFLFFRMVLGKKNIFFFPFYHTGGGERVHLDIVKTADKKKSITIFTNYSGNDHFYEDFKKHSHVVNLAPYINHSFYRRLLLFLFRFVGVFNTVTTFGCNSSFYYEVLPYLRKRITKVDLLHAFSYPTVGMEIVSLPYVQLLDLRIVINRKTKEDYINLYKEHHIPDVYVERIRVIPNMVEVPGFERNANLDCPLKVLYCGRISHEKRVHLVVEIGKKLPDTCQLKIIGPAAMEVEHINLFYKGSVTGTEEMHAVYKETDILLITSYREGFPMVVMEAMARGVVCICTDVGGIGEHIVHGENGFLVENSQDEQRIVEEFVNLITRLDLDRNLLAKLSTNAYGYAKENFGKETFIDHYQQVLSS